MPTATTLDRLLREAPPEAAGALRELLREMPAALRERCAPLTLAAGRELLRMGDPCDTVYLLVEGDLQAVNPDPAGNQYAYARFAAPELFGEFETLAGAPDYRSTLIALTECRLISMAAADFLRWMREDHHALFLRTRAITRHLVDQTSRERRHLFLSATDRLVVYLVRCCEGEPGEGVHLVSATRQQIADETGYCVKTVNRCVSRLREQGLVGMRGKRIAIDRKQYEALRALERAAGS